jgi:hypothetical protein
MNFGTNGCMYNCGDSCTGECIEPTVYTEQHPLENTLQNLKDFRSALIKFSAPENVGGWSLANLPTHFWETIGECINDIEEHIKIENHE